MLFRMKSMVFCFCFADVNIHNNFLKCRILRIITLNFTGSLPGNNFEKNKEKI